MAFVVCIVYSIFRFDCLMKDRSFEFSSHYVVSTSKIATVYLLTP